MGLGLFYQASQFRLVDRHFECFQFVLLSFHYEFHAAIREIADIADHFKTVGQILHRVAKTNTLNVASIKDL